MDPPISEHIQLEQQLQNLSDTLQTADPDNVMEVLDTASLIGRYLIYLKVYFLKMLRHLETRTAKKVLKTAQDYIIL